MDKYNDILESIRSAHKAFGQLPPKVESETWIQRLFTLLFTPQSPGTEMKTEFSVLARDLETLLGYVLKSDSEVKEVSTTFFGRLPHVHSELLEDAEAILKGDPAATSREEVILTYPGFYATAVYRLSHELVNLDVPLLPRLFSEHAHGTTGIDIHPGAQIGKSFAIDHGTGVVIGETALIGNSVKLYQGVTLGALSVSKEEANRKRHPTVEDNVTIYSGATILGGNTTIGHDSVIGGNVFLTYTVPAFSLVYHKSEIRVRDNYSFPEPINFSI